MNKENLSQQTKKGLIWSAIERFSLQGSMFLFGVVLARLLEPEEFGIIGMLSIFLAVSNAFVDCGFSQALIRKQNRSEIDNSTVFYFNMIIACIMYGICFLIAPWVASFFKIPVLKPLLKLIALTLIINAFSAIQKTLLTAKLDFKTQAKASLVSVFLSGLIGIFLAWKGLSFWALAWQQIAKSILLTILLWILSSWRPILKFSWNSIREFFSFGSKILISGLIENLYLNIRPLIIAKAFSPADLGFYSKAGQFSSLPSSTLTQLFQRVTFPVLCTVQEETDRLSYVYRKMLRLSAFIIFPMMMGLAVTSKPLILVLLGEKWLFSAELLTILCFSMMWYPIHAINLNLLQVKGRSDLFLRLEIIKKIIGIIGLCITVPFGLKAMCYGGIVTGFISLAINTFYTGKLINVGFFLQMKDIFPTLLLSLTMFLLVYFFNICFIIPPLHLHLFKCLINISNLLQLFFNIISGILFFASISFFLRFSELTELKNFIFSSPLKNKINNTIKSRP